MSPIKTAIADFRLEYLNDWLTVARFAEHHEMSEIDTLILIALGCKFHQERCDEHASKLMFKARQIAA